MSLISESPICPGLCDLGLPGIEIVASLNLPHQIYSPLTAFCLNGSSGCTSCFIKHKPVASLDEKPKKVGSQHQTGRKSSISVDFWTTSICDMDNSVQGSMSSVSTSIQALDTHAGASGSNPPSEFVNHGLLLWNQTRQHWIGNKKQISKGQQIRDPKLSWNATYESLLGSNKPFAQPVSLAEMVDFLVDIWEQEGMYD